MCDLDGWMHAGATLEKGAIQDYVLNLEEGYGQKGILAGVLCSCQSYNIVHCIKIFNGSG
jgi:hypothetical protein